LLFMINAIFRGAGDAAVAMHCLWLANLCNLVLDPLLIFGLGPFPKLGVAGAAVATTVGRGIGVAFQVYRLLRRDRRFVIERRHLRLHWPVMLNLARMARNSIFQIMVATISWTAIVRIVALFGDFAVAGYTSAIRVFLFALLPAWGLSNAAATMVGQSLGARDPARAAAAVWKAGFFNMLCLGSVGIVFQFTAPTIARIFTDNDEVAHHLVVALRIISAGYPFYAYGMVFSNGFNGAGDSRTPTILNLFCFWLWEIPLAWLLAVPLGLGVPGVCAAIAVAFSTLAIAGGVMFRRGHWQTKKV
jgi:putative MATE family efflux protein